jgi:hypothetical protein
MKTINRPIGVTLTVAAALRHAAHLNDPARRADAVCDALGRLRPPPPAAATIFELLDDDGRGETDAPTRRVLLAAAHALEEIASTALGVEGGPLTDPGRVRRSALRANHPNAKSHRRRSSRRHSPPRGRR